jgi:hypothetical protein
MFVREDNLGRENLDTFGHVGDVLFIPNITCDETGDLFVDGRMPERP